MGDGENDDKSASEYHGSESDRLAERRKDARRDRWDEATSEHWQNTALTNESRGGPAAERAGDGAFDDEEVALEHWDDDGGTNVVARPSMNRSRATQPIRIASHPPL